MTQAIASANRAPHPSGLADVLDLVLDKGIVIDAYVRLSLVGIEILTLDARVVIASVDTYLRFAEAVNRLDIQPKEQAQGLPGLVGSLQEKGASGKTKGALSGVKESAKDVVSNLRGNDDDSGKGSNGRSNGSGSNGSGSNGGGSNGSGRPRAEARRSSGERRSRSDGD